MLSSAPQQPTQAPCLRKMLPTALVTRSSSPPSSPAARNTAAALPSLISHTSRSSTRQARMAATATSVGSPRAASSRPT
eukprot:CAMPEP_0113679502 /NCGR_PEP_ID=MMETSP0038_2-20120614/10683_1 /TAXON_ID=2898 /ORGANISM="Cryptomonas paramecium" /LENGTH=78 /DNA_ID=CAMNT_0000597547 /DNA_START=578 /DNA_END=811 /DNA_ORIENTATION=+ /assembly_acc=CAM_ASM_000170